MTLITLDAAEQEFTESVAYYQAQDVAYTIRQDTIWVVAIVHGHRRPEFWLDRI